MMALVGTLQGRLTATLRMPIADDRPLAAARLLPLLSDKAGRVLFSSYPPAWGVCDAMVHGGPGQPPPTRAASVGTDDRTFSAAGLSAERPAALLPPALRDANPFKPAAHGERPVDPGSDFPSC